MAEENQTSIPPETAPETANQPSENLVVASPASGFWRAVNSRALLVALTLIAAGGLYLVTADSQGWWPFGSTVPLASPSLSPSPTQEVFVPDPYAGWQTYRNEEYGFEVKYPRDWVYKLLDDADEGAGVDGAETDPYIYRLRFAPEGFFQDRFKSPENFTIEVIPAQSEFYRSSPREFADSLKVWGEYGITFSESKPALEGAEEILARDYKYNGQALRFVVFAKKDQSIYALSAIFSDSKVVFNKFNQILSTFRFIEPGVCIQVITPARNVQTGEVRDFPTPCDVPEGWEKI